MEQQCTGTKVSSGQLKAPHSRITEQMASRAQAQTDELTDINTLARNILLRLAPTPPPTPGQETKAGQDRIKEVSSDFSRQMGLLQDDIDYKISQLRAILNQLDNF